MTDKYDVSDNWEVIWKFEHGAWHTKLRECVVTLRVGNYAKASYELEVSYFSSEMESFGMTPIRIIFETSDLEEATSKILEHIDRAKAEGIRRLLLHRAAFHHLKSQVDAE